VSSRWSSTTSGCAADRLNETVFWNLQYIATYTVIKVELFKNFFKRDTASICPKNQCSESIIIFLRIWIRILPIQQRSFTIINKHSFSVHHIYHKKFSRSQRAIISLRRIINLKKHNNVEENKAAGSVTNQNAPEKPEGTDPDPEHCGKKPRSPLHVNNPNLGHRWRCRTKRFFITRSTWRRNSSTQFLHNSHVTRRGGFFLYSKRLALQKPAVKETGEAEKAWSKGNLNFYWKLS
jgi:hypothetical protein